MARDWEPRVTSDWGSSASSSRAQPRDLLPCRNQRVCAEGKRCLGAASHQAMSVLQYRFLGYARNDDSAKRYQNSAVLRSFDSVLPFQISHFLTYDVFLRSG